MAYSDKEKQRAFQRDWQRQQRLARRDKVFSLLGGVCSFCGIGDPRVLQVDHIDPLLRQSASERHATSGSGLISKLFTGQTPLELVQLLCANCHCIKTHEVDRLMFKNRKVDATGFEPVS